MGLETGSFIDDLVITNPLGSDAKNKGDDHLRLVKKVVKATFPGMTGAAWRVQAKGSAYTVVAGDNMTVLNCTAALTLTLTAAATLGNQHLFITHANGGDVTIDPNGAETINGSATLVVADGSTAIVVCNGTLFRAFITPTVLTAAALTLLDDATVAVMLATLGIANHDSISVTASGEATNAEQPAFLAFNSASDTNVTGNGAVATIDFDTEVFDQGANFAADTFTAPVTGRYLLMASLRITGMTAAADSIVLDIVTSNRTYQAVWNNPNDVNEFTKVSISAVVDMDAADTVTIQLTIAGEASDVVDIIGAANPNTYFSGYLLT